MTYHRALAGLLAAMSLTMLLAPQALAVNDPPPAGGWVVGNWNVTDSRSYENVNIFLYAGNLIIKSGGSLTLDHCLLMMYLDTNGQSYIEVQSGGTLVLKNGCTVMSNSADRHYYFRVRAGGTLLCGNSTLRDLGYTSWSGSVENYGLYVASQNVAIDKCVFTESYYGVYLDGVSPSVTNCNFNNIPSYQGSVNAPTACLGASHSKASLYGNQFSNSYIGLALSASSISVGNCNFTTNGYGAQFASGSDIEVSDCTFTQNTYWGAYVNDGTECDIHDCRFVNNSIYYSSGAAALYQDRSSGRFYRNNVTCSYYGYAVHASDSSPVVDACALSTTYRVCMVSDYLSNVKVSNTTLYSYTESAVFTDRHATLEMSRCNLTSYAGNVAVADNYATLRLANCSVRATYRYSYGYALYADHYACITAQDSTVSTFDAWYDAVYVTNANLELRKVGISAHRYGLVLYTGTAATLDKCTVTSEDVGVVAAYQGTRVYLVNGTSVSSRNNIGLYLTEARADLRTCSVHSQGSIALYCNRGVLFNAVNSTLTTSTSGPVIYLDAGGANVCNLTNTMFDQFRVVFTEPTSVVNVFWYLNVTVQWQNAARAPEALVNVTNILGQKVAEGVTGPRGELPFIVVQEYRRTQLLWENYTSHDIWAFKNGVKKMEKRTIRGTTVVLMTLSDPDAPALNMTFPPNGYQSPTGDLLVCGTAEDLVSGLARVEYMVDGKNPALVDGMQQWSFRVNLADGRHTLKVHAVDQAGMARDVVISILVDSVISLEVDYPAEGAFLNRSRVNVTGVAEAYSNVTADGNSFPVDADGLFDIAVELGEGPHTLVVTAADSTGNIKTVTRNITIDTLPPSLVLDSPINGSSTSLPYMMFCGTVQPGSRLLIGGELRSTEGNGSFSVIVPLAEGNNTITVLAEDAAGNTNSTVVRVHSDTIPPMLNVTSPADGSLTSHPNITVTGETDGSRLLLNGVEAEVKDGRFSAILHLEEGDNLLRLDSRDEAGNANITLMHLTLDTRPPFLQVATPAADLSTNIASLAVLGATESGAQVTVNAQPASNDNGTFTLNLRLLAGNNSIVIKAEDRAGNAAYINRTVVLDQTPPTLTITNPAAGMRTPDERLTVKGKTERGCTVTVNGNKAQLDEGGSFSYEVPLSQGENSLVITAVDGAGNPTTKIAKVVRTGAIDLGAEETPMLAMGLLIGLAAGAAVGLYLGARKRKKEVVLMAPEEPMPGRYDVPEELPPPTPAPLSGYPASALDEDMEERPSFRSSPLPAAAPSPPPRVPEQTLPSVPEAEAVPVTAIRTIPAAPEADQEVVPWDEAVTEEPAVAPPHGRGRPRGSRERRREEDKLDQNLEDILKRLNP